MNKQTSAAHEKQIALMKWLAKATRKLKGPTPKIVGNHIFVVGGAVRNYILDVPIKDIDIVVDSVALGGLDSAWYAKQLQRLLPAKSSLTTNQYGVAILSVSGDWHLGQHNLKGEVIEIANARTESYGGAEGKGYKPSEVVPATIEEDVRRREFRFNTLLWRMSELASGPEKAEILDITGCGKSDLQKGEMHCPSDPDKTFRDDPSRMLRAIKFLVKYGLKVPPDVAASIKRNAPLLKSIPQEAVASLLVGTILKEDTADRALSAMAKLGLFKVIQEMFETDTAFKTTLNNWADHQKFSFLFKLLDAGLPLSGQMGFLSSPQKARFREIAGEHGQEFAAELLAAMRQPGKVIDTRRLMVELGVKGKEVGKLGQLARQLLLDEPLLLTDPVKLTNLVGSLFERGQEARHLAAAYLRTATSLVCL